MNITKETLDYFKSIPEDQWCTDFQKNEKGQHCAIGFLGKQDGLEIDNLNTYYDPRSDFKRYELFQDISTYCQRENPIHTYNIGIGSMYIVGVNNGGIKEYKQKTPKQRVVALLEDVLAYKQQNSVQQELQHQQEEQTELIYD